MRRLALPQGHIVITVQDHRRVVTDGQPHVSVFLHGTNFVWSGIVNDPIEVEAGEAGEPVEYLIWLRVGTNPLMGIDLLPWFLQVCLDFHNAMCESGDDN